MMELKLLTKRRFENIIRRLSDGIAETLFSEYGITADTIDTTRMKELENYILDGFSTKHFSKLWNKMELANLFQSWVSVFTSEPIDISFSQFKNKIDSLKLTNNRTIIMELSTSPKIFYFCSLSSNFRSMMDRAAAPNLVRDQVYWAPEHGISFFNIHEDEVGKKFKEDVESVITGKLEPFRIKAMIISKYYRETRMITQLNVSAIFEITGFAGFDEIRFKGPSVHQGLYGLHKRQDIRVNLDQIGPNIEAADDHLHLKIGPKVKVKSLEGINKLSEIIRKI